MSGRNYPCGSFPVCEYNHQHHKSGSCPNTNEPVFIMFLRVESILYQYTPSNTFLYVHRSCGSSGDLAQVVDASFCSYRDCRLLFPLASLHRLWTDHITTAPIQSRFFSLTDWKGCGILFMQSIAQEEKTWMSSTISMDSE